MEIIAGTTDFYLEKDTAVAIGKFDGVHLGHAAQEPEGDPPGRHPVPPRRQGVADLVEEDGEEEARGGEEAEEEGVGALEEAGVLGEAEEGEVVGQVPPDV